MGQPNPPDPGDIPHHMTVGAASKPAGRKEKGRCLELSSQVTVTCEGPQLSGDG